VWNVPGAIDKAWDHEQRKLLKRIDGATRTRTEWTIPSNVTLAFEEAKKLVDV
jgi:hypothetical protein